MADQTKTLRVELSERSYDIDIGSGNLPELPDFMGQRTRSRHAVLITDTNVDPLYADELGDQLTESDWEVHLLVIDAGEPSKSADVSADVWETMLQEGADRQSCVVAVGGGVVGDLAGFVAATFARGLDFFQVPTTLLAQVDSSVGGKVGINLSGAKNMVGAFWQPQGVLIDVDVLETLPDREYRAGLAEVVKYGVILDADFFATLQEQADAINSQQASVLRDIVERCCRLKADVVEQDERETSGLRAVLNYGHTFAHAFEAAGNYGALLHGEAVSLGMMCAARLAERMGRVDGQFVERQRQLLAALQLPLALPEFDHQQLIQLMYRDKKVADGQLRFVLPDRMGHVELVSGARVDDVLASLND